MPGNLRIICSRLSRENKRLYFKGKFDKVITNSAKEKGDK